MMQRYSPHASDVRSSERMWPVVWEALEQWGDDAARVEPLAGGVANEVWRVRVNGHLAVGRLSARSDADLAWETELLQHLVREGLTVPVPIPTTDGRLFADGLVVMTYVEGGPPETEADWRRVADTLGQLHRLTQGWPQRPGWRSSTDLLHARDWDEDRPRRDAGRGCCSMPSSVGAAQRTSAVRRPRRPQPGQHPHDRGSGRADRLGRVACRCPRPRPGAACITPPVSRSVRMTSPLKRGRHGKPPSAGTTSTQSSGSLKFERSEQRQADQETAQPAHARPAGGSFGHGHRKDNP